MIRVTKKSLVWVAILLLHTAFVSAQNSFEKNLRNGQQLLQTGQVNAALDALQNAYQQVHNGGSETERKQQISIMLTLGEAYVRGQKFTQAEDWLEKSYKLAKTISDPHLLSAICHRFGLLYATQNNPDQSVRWYTKALTYAKRSSDHALLASSYLNLSKHQPEQAQHLIKQAYSQVQSITENGVKSKLLLAMGYQAQQLQQTVIANQALRKVLRSNPQPRQKAQALGYLGSLYEQQGRDDEALSLTRQAIVANNSPDLLIKWEQQQARLLRKKGELQAAIQAYQRAVMHIESIRKDIPVFYQNGQSSFRETLAPIYLGLIDLLLQQSDNSLVHSEKNISQSQQIWERFKSAELNDYFRNTCEIKQTSLNEWQARNSDTAILYPILLENRLEILLSINQKISRYRVEVTTEQITDSVNGLFNAIQAAEPLSNHKKLYQWLIQPIHDKLTANNITTIVYIPDGVLRRVPLGVLNDGQRYLIEQYAVVTNPGMSMLSAKQTTVKKAQQVLLAGMSTPGPVVNELIDINFFEANTDNKTRDMTQVQRALRSNEIKKSLSLPAVETELELLASTLGSSVIKNKQFTRDNFQKAVLKGQNIIHIASHGYFSGNPEQSFIMTYDHLVNMNDLISLFQTEAFSDSPVELISLSACQTAEGDDRSPLGLSGVVVQAGVRSAIGTLWRVVDEAAQKVFTSFYQYYGEQGMSKAQALRQAQLDMLQKKNKFNDSVLNQFPDHPVLWGAFILIGDWQ